MRVALFITDDSDCTPGRQVRFTAVLTYGTLCVDSIEAVAAYADNLLRISDTV